MERSGKVIITRDGKEILSTLEICDPIVKITIDALFAQRSTIGDGTKVSFILLRKLLESLDFHIPVSSCETSRRQQIIKVLHEIQGNVLPTLMKKCMQYGTVKQSFYEIGNLKNILTEGCEGFFTCKFPKLISKSLSKLVINFLFYSCISGNDFLKRILNLYDSQISIFEVYKISLLKSSISEGYILTRDFKYFNINMNTDDVKTVFWTLDIEHKNGNGDSFYKLELCEEMILKSVSYKQNCFQKYASYLKSNGITCILSSVYFPDWAVSECRSQGISLVDMIDKVEWDFLVTHFKCSSIHSYLDLLDETTYIMIERVAPIVLGTGRFAKLSGIGCHQIVLCGSTVTQCKQFSAACHNALKYIKNWVEDSISFSDWKDNCENPNKNSLYYLIGKKSVNLDFHEVNSGLYYVPSGGYLELLLLYLIDNCEIVPKVSVIGSVLKTIFLEVPSILHRKACRKSHSNFLNYLTEVNNSFAKMMQYGCIELNNHREKSKKSALSAKENEKNCEESEFELTTDILHTYFKKQKFKCYQNPITTFHILLSVIQTSLLILNIECIFSTNKRISRVLEKNYT
ncbi:unnamed protein product [Meganyctiphanes norvegica]|uniref:Uncharacterized protein n=1 Tax=Meganyctiphanes norvegica TaxID=48144 RepID=A0AAV2SJQ1_MEGNR